MAKDPAVLWYFNDWHGGTVTFSRFLKGCYMDLLYAQFNNGHLSIDEIKTVLGSDYGSAWPNLQKKFKVDELGLYYNERLLFEKSKRKSYSKSRKDNLEGNSKGSMGAHMENENAGATGNVSSGKGGSGGKPDLIEIYFTDLPNSTALERACMDLRVSKQELIASIPEFRETCNTEYKNLNELATHLKRWYRKRNAAPLPGKLGKADQIIAAYEQSKKDLGIT